MTPPFAQGYLPIAQGHKVAWYEFGNPAGIPVLFLHGGPGSGFNRDYLGLFPLERMRFITFDQRGSGASSPFAELENNTTGHILADIEALRKLLKVESWIVVGHSWGSTLAVIYAKAYPQMCRRLLLASFFGAQPEDQLWTFDGVRLFFPQEVEALHALHTDKTITFMQWVNQALHGENQAEIAYRLACITGNSCRLNPAPVLRDNITAQSIGRWQILMHYGVHDFFIRPGELYAGLDVLQMPVHALHGRFDMDCPPAQVMRLKAALPGLHLTIASGNHSVLENPMADVFSALVRDVCHNDG